MRQLYSTLKRMEKEGWRTLTMTMAMSQTRRGGTRELLRALQRRIILALGLSRTLMPPPFGGFSKVTNFFKGARRPPDSALS
ncbi:hypothetical protein J4Q44_G00206250 [Coregonus suidteri]|uniref:Uncharacterized protein n=1 Tax=Coregonus suidteri TaxID=861788 RepID=A0AAN8LIF4_9TELE